LAALERLVDLLLDLRRELVPALHAGRAIELFLKPREESRSVVEALRRDQISDLFKTRPILRRLGPSLHDLSALGVLRARARALERALRILELALGVELEPLPIAFGRLVVSELGLGTGRRVALLRTVRVRRVLLRAGSRRARKRHADTDESENDQCDAEESHGHHVLPFVGTRFGFAFAKRSSPDTRGGASTLTGRRGDDQGQRSQVDDEGRTARGADASIEPARSRPFE